MRTVTLLGVPSDVNSSYLSGAAQGPAAIRAALYSPSSNLASERGSEMGIDFNIRDAGDMEILEAPDDFERIRLAAEMTAQDGPMIFLGGDHSITYPLVAGIAALHGPVDILHFDAHPDLYENFEGNRFSHASPFARILEDGLAARLVQVGIRTMNAAQRPVAARYGVESYSVSDAVSAPIPAGPLYVTIDLDAFDPAFCPGVSHYEPGGLSVRDVLDVLRRIERPIVGGDVVELNPSRDEGGRSAYVAAKLVKELAALAAMGDKA